MSKPPPSFTIRDNVPLARLHLDSMNPRFEGIDSEEEIIHALFKAERVLSIAKDIAKKGAISPLDRIGVIEMPDNPGHYTVAEGNRRICALKVLHDPRKAPTMANRRAIENLPGRAALPGRFDLVVFRDRDAARAWLELRHLGEQSGIGTRRWNTQQKARFARGSSPDRLALQIMDRATASGWVDTGTRKKIPLTTLTRYLGNPVVRAALGIGSRGDLVFTHNPDEVDAALKQFVLDAVPRSDGSEAPVNSRSDSAQRRQYAQSLHARGIAPVTVARTPKAPPPPKRGGPLGKPRNPRHPSNRPTILPTDLVVKYSDKNLQRLLAEGRKLKPDDGFEFSANYLLRAIIERILVLYAKKRGVFESGMRDSKLVQACHDELVKDGVGRNELKNMRTAYSNPDISYSLHTLGAAVHAASVPGRRDLIRVWDNWEPSLQLILGRL